MKFRLIERTGTCGDYRFSARGFADLDDAEHAAAQSECEYLIEDIAGKVLQYRIAD